MSVCEMEFSISYIKLLKLNTAMKHIKISPGSKSYDSQQEVKGCFGN